jgi:serine/threonine protein kinase
VKAGPEVSLTEPVPFGKYTLLEKIGVGGMAEIWKSRATGPDGFEKVLVVKKILPEFARDTAFVQMLIAEAKVTSLLHHPNIVQIYELGEIDDQYYITMELVEGSDLLRVLSRCTREKLRVPTEIALYIISEVSKGLAHAHAATDSSGRALNIIHRDVSPSNILISTSGAVKIMDFGVAAADLGVDPTLPDSPAKNDVLKGKLGYMSPEQVEGKPLDRRSDIFAMGVILFECLTLKRLFVGVNDAQTLMNVRNADIERKFKRHSYIPRPIRAIIRRALAKDPDERFQTATDVQEAILDYLFESRLRVSSRTLATFLHQVLMTGRPAEDAPSEAGRAVTPRPELVDQAVDRSAATVPEHEAVPALPASAHRAIHRPRDLRRVDLTRATFRLKNDGETVFGPIDFAALSGLLASRSVGPREWVSINESDWLQTHDVRSIVDLNPALFEPESDRPVWDGPINRLSTPHVLHQIYKDKLAGRLKLTLGTVFKEIYFDHGAPVVIHSNLKSELGPLPSNGEQPSGATATFEDRFVAPLTWDTGWYEFFGGQLPRVPPKKPDLPRPSPPVLLMHGIRLHYDLSDLSRIFDDYLDKPIAASASLARSEDQLGLTTAERTVCDSIRSNVTLSQLLDRHAGTEAERLNLLRVTFALYQTDKLAFFAKALT